MKFILEVLCSWERLLEEKYYRTRRLSTPRISEYQFSPTDERTLFYRSLQVPTFSTLENIFRQHNSSSFDISNISSSTVL